MSNIYSERNNLLNSLSFSPMDPPAISTDTENDLNLWANAQFTYDIKPTYTEEHSESSSPPNEMMAYGELSNFFNPQLMHQPSQPATLYPKNLHDKPYQPLFPKLSLGQLANVLSSPILVDDPKNNSNTVNTTQKKPSADEDKRKRNTAASARFRVKKKLKEQDKEKSVREMTEKSELLEKRVNDLEQEIKWLRGLLIEKGSN